MYLRVLAAFAALFAVVSLSAPAEARKYRADVEQSDDDTSDRSARRSARRKVSREQSSDDASESRRSKRKAHVSPRGDDGDDDSGKRHSGVGPRPGAWCGWYMRTRHGGGPEMNLAANWRRYGSAGSPQVGAIVVWPHHVGEIVGRASNGQWIVLSGNDSGTVRRRPRSISGATVRV